MQHGTGDHDGVEGSGCASLLRPQQSLEPGKHWPSRQVAPFAEAPGNGQVAARARPRLPLCSRTGGHAARPRPGRRPPGSGHAAVTRYSENHDPPCQDRQGQEEEGRKGSFHRGDRASGMGGTRQLRGARWEPRARRCRALGTGAQRGDKQGPGRPAGAGRALPHGQPRPLSVQGVRGRAGRRSLEGVGRSRGGGGRTQRTEMF